MIRSMAIALALAAGTATAGEPMDCFNDETDSGTRYTSKEPEVLRITAADLSDMLTRIRESESHTVVSVERDPALQVSLSNETSASD